MPTRTLRRRVGPCSPKDQIRAWSFASGENSQPGSRVACVFNGGPGSVSKTLAEGVSRNKFATYRTEEIGIMKRITE